MCSPACAYAHVCVLCCSLCCPVLATMAALQLHRRLLCFALPLPLFSASLHTLHAARTSACCAYQCVLCMLCTPVHAVPGVDRLIHHRHLLMLPDRSPWQPVNVNNCSTGSTTSITEQYRQYNARSALQHQQYQHAWRSNCCGLVGSREACGAVVGQPLGLHASR